jgi:hypothetical protein
MKKYLLSLMLFIAGIGVLAGPAAAAPVVVVGSTYSIYLQGRQSGEPFLGVTEFDPAEASATRAGLNLRLTEWETSLGGGVSRITINLSADGDLFPITGEQAILAIGADGNGLDLITQVLLDDARITFRNAANDVLRVSDNMAGDVPQNNAWDGFFPAPLNAFGIDGVGGLGVSMITFDFLVTEIQNEVPEPGSIVLAGIGLLGVFAVRRRNRKSEIRG